VEEIQLATRIQLRRDIEADWVRDNPVLLPGEIAISLDLNKFKIGTGSRWDVTPYATSVTSQDLENSLSSYVEIGDVGNPGGPAKLDGDGNLLIPKDKIIIEGATANDHELTLQSPDISSDVTVTLPNLSGTVALSSQIVTSYNNLTDKPSLFSGSYTDLTDKPTLFDGDYDSLANKPTLFDGDYDSLANKPVLFSESYLDLTDKPTLFDGDYDSLANKPTIPSLDGYATESYVGTAISNLVDSAPETLNTLNELAAAINDDASYAATITTALGEKEPLLPEQAENNGKFLTTNGTAKSWATVPVTSQATDQSLGTVYSRIAPDSSLGFGRDVLRFSTGYGNAGFGIGSMWENTSGYLNTAVGSYALSKNEIGYGNTAVGAQALNQTTSSSNNAFGSQALRYNTTGSSNSAFGNDSMNTNVDGYSNSAFGQSSLYSNVSGYRNSAFGLDTLSSSTGNQNVAIGYSSGSDLTSGDNNTAIGYNAQFSNTTISNEIVVGNASNNRFRIPGLGIDWTIDTVPSSSGGGAEGADIMNIMEAW
jgi:hypothetical protein